MKEQEGKQLPVPVIIIGIIAVLGIAAFAGLQFLKPSAGGAAEAAAIVKDIKASPNTPTIPREQVMAEVVDRGAPGQAPRVMGGGVKKNSGR